jgi:GDPmannose 4,6-dehydratase
MGKKALITGITGQDGYHLAEFLHGKGYAVYGIVRRSTQPVEERLGRPAAYAHLEYADLTDSLSLLDVLGRVQPDEVYNLAGQSHVSGSFRTPETTLDVTGSGCLRMLEAVRQASPHSRFYQASSSEMFGRVTEEPQRETTPFHPRSPYGVAKVAAYWATVNYREEYGLFACNGILFNHESERRGEEFVTRKITRAVARIKLGLQRKVSLGSLDARRDWGYAPDYVRAMWLMLQCSAPDDYVVASGVTHSVREFCATAFGHVGMNWEDHVEVDPGLVRRPEAHQLVGDAGKIRAALGWQPTVTFEDMIERMVRADLNALESETRK